ncbi:MAG: hypothetical protein AAF322_00050 [Pseudomonadota bacterium]
MKHARPADGARLIQVTSNPKPVRCSRTSAVPAEDPCQDPAIAGSTGFEDEPLSGASPVNLKSLSPEIADDAVWAASDMKAIPIASLYRAASEEFRIYLDATSGGWATLADFSFAAAMRRRELRIRDCAWAAAEALGEIDRPSPFSSSTAISVTRTRRSAIRAAPCLEW